jgi:hypothetical protein
MKVGDILEWLAAAAFVVAANLATHLAWPAVAVAGAFLVYFAQCYSTHPVTLPKLARPQWLHLPQRKQVPKEQAE